MFEGLVGNIEQHIHASPWLALGVAFIGGALTATSPCVLASIPLMIGYVAGRSEREVGPLRGLGYSLLFVLGLSITFSFLGFLAALAGKLYGDVPRVWNYVAAVVFVLMGAHFAGFLRLPMPRPVQVRQKMSGALGAFLLGLLFGVVSAPCAAPVLIVLLTYLAGAGSSLVYGGALLLLYALGHSLLILVAGTSMGAARRLIESKGLARATGGLRRVAGVLIILTGIYFALTGAH